MDFIADYVEFHFYPFYEINVPIVEAEFTGRVYVHDRPVNDQEPMIAHFSGMARLGNRGYDVEAVIPIQSLDDLHHITPGVLAEAQWEQELDFLGFWWELKHVFWRWRKFRYGWEVRNHVQKED